MVDVEVLYVVVVAPAMFVQGPVAVGADCHWYVIPVTTLNPVADKVKGDPSHPFVTDDTAVDAFGVPDQSGAAITEMR